MASSGASGSSNVVAGANVHERTGPDAWALGNPTGNYSGETYNGTDSNNLQTQYEAIFGPAGRDIKVDPQRHKRHQRWHLPDNLKGRNEYLTDRIDGLITDATNSPFTRNILPYVYLDQPDQKIKWNVYSFDEGMASRVPYESAARVLTQSKTSHSGYAVRQGLAIVMEHNFLASPAGVTNFQNQLKQLVGSIQLTNDLDVHMALLTAKSYQRTINEKYYSESESLYDSAKRYVDLFGIMQKMPNALDILIEDAKSHLKTWGSQPPTFLLCPSDLTAQLQMSPERTNYITNGPDGLKRLAEGPNLPSYRGISIIHSQKFSLEPGKKPRNVLKRRVRVAEHYWIDLSTVTSYQIYNQKKDMMCSFDRTHAWKMSGLSYAILAYYTKKANDEDRDTQSQQFHNDVITRQNALQAGYCLLIRPNIEHEMLTVIAGRGGTQELGATFWGQTELACYDDAQHGIWGMSYKYHERAIVTNERNLIRMFDVAFDGYSGGMDTDIADWSHVGNQFTDDTYSTEPRYKGKSVLALHFPRFMPQPALQGVLIRPLFEMFLLCDAIDSTSLMHYDNMARLTVSDSTMQLENLSSLSTLLNKREVAECFQSQDLVDYYTRAESLEGTNNVRPYGAALDSTDLFDKNTAIRDQQNLGVNFATHLSAVIEGMVKQCVARRPLQAEAMYRRVLQVVFQRFRQGVAPMTEQTTTKVMAYVLARGVTFSSTQFQQTFMTLINILVLHWTYAGDVTGLAPTGIQGAVPTLTYLICMLHGIEVSNTHDATNNDAPLTPQAWHYTQNNMQITNGHTGMMEKTRGVAQALVDDLPTLLRHYIFDLQCLNNHYYNMYRLVTKPPFEMPNPVVLSSFLRDKQASNFQTSPDADQASDASDLHNFKIAFKKYFEEPDDSPFQLPARQMMQDIDDYFDMYNSYAPELWSSNSIMAASAYMQNNATELPAFSYHGNLVCQKTSGVSEEVRCVGHLGNSFPGSACIRQGKGMLNIYEKMPLPVHVM
jgi:hypothetical protein